jgi:glycyl-tRNA synthetase beta chain
LLVGTIEDRFMALPAEVLQSSIETHQKYITLQSHDGSFSPHFVVVSNRLADDERDAVILAGNQRVLRARLEDAAFFWGGDRRTPLADFLPRLADIAFYKGLGTVNDKAQRLEKLAADIAAAIPGANAAIAARAGLLAKADLVTGMVGEFPELQGIMGGYYATGAGEDAAAAEAIAAHYRPQGPDDSLPATAEGLAVALADKIDTLVGFFGVGARPTGSKDPFALRRAALGVIRILTETNISLSLNDILRKSAGYHGFTAIDDELLPFIRERLRVSLRDTGIAHDVVAAALGDGELDDICLLADRAAALSTFLGSENGAGLMAGWRRAASILKSEESKDKQAFAPKTDPSLFVKTAETDLHVALEALPTASSDADLDAALTSLGGMRAPIDRFFDEVVVNDDNPSIRGNRLGLLAMVREKMLGVADFSKLEG